MRILLGSMGVAAAGALAMGIAAGAAPAAPGAHLTLSGPSLKQGFVEANLLNAFGCTGSNLSPELKWSGAPAATRSFVVTLYDPDDHDNPSGWWHWVVYDIPGSVSQLPA